MILIREFHVIAEAKGVGEKRNFTCVHWGVVKVLCYSHDIYLTALFQSAQVEILCIALIFRQQTQTLASQLSGALQYVSPLELCLVTADTVRKHDTVAGQRSSPNLCFLPFCSDLFLSTLLIALYFEDSWM